MLNAADMVEVARAYLPEGYNVPVGFHGIWASNTNSHKSQNPDNKNDENV